MTDIGEIKTWKYKGTEHNVWHGADVGEAGNCWEFVAGNDQAKLGGWFTSGQLRAIADYIDAKRTSEQSLANKGNAQMLKIEPSIDHVLICGQYVKRPFGLTRSLWMKFWEQVAGLANSRAYK